jgi:hypothetical protein
MKKTSYRAKIMLLSVLAALFLMPTGWGAGGSSIARLGPAPVLAQAATPIQPGENLNRDVGGGCGSFTTTFTFSANADDVVFIRVLRCLDFNDCGGSQPCVQLNQGSNVITPRICASSEVLIRQKLPFNGPYSIIYSEDGRGTGRYNFFLQRVNNPGRAEPLSSGDDQLAFLNGCGEVDTYTFKARAGDRVKINMTRAEVGNVVPRLELYDDQGRVLEAAGTSTIDRVLTSSGTFTVLAYSNGTETGSYRISLTVVPSMLNLPLVFSGQAGEETRQTCLRLTNTADVPVRGTLEFFEPDGVTPMEVTINGVRDFQFPFSIPAGGVRIFCTEGTRPLAQGIAKVTAEVGGIKADVILRSVNQMDQTVFETAYSTPTPTRALTISVDSVGPATDTGLVILNPPPFPGEPPQTAMITLRLVNRQGQQVGQVMLSAEAGALAIGSEGEIIRFITELFKDVPGIDEFQGTVVVSSSISVSVLTVQKRDNRLTVVPGF